VASSDSTAENGSNTTPEIFGSAARDTGRRETPTLPLLVKSGVAGAGRPANRFGLVEDDDDALPATMPATPAVRSTPARRQDMRTEKRIKESTYERMN
jgi:hypothetical protein